MMTLWYLGRAAGIVALVAFTASIFLGALSSSRDRAARPRDAEHRYLLQMAHRSAAICGLLALTCHVGLLVLDSYVDVTIGGVLIPFTAGYRPLALAMGTVGVYAFVLAAVSGAARGRLATSARAARSWRSVHATAYVGWVLAMAHGILAGTDTGSLWSTATYVTCGSAVAVAGMVRLTSLRRTATELPMHARTLERSSR
jgi:sulfoxide reductase heme-binding subunit YedZ